MAGNTLVKYDQVLQMNDIHITSLCHWIQHIHKSKQIYLILVKRGFIQQTYDNVTNCINYDVTNLFINMLKSINKALLQIENVKVVVVMGFVFTFFHGKFITSRLLLI